MPLWWLSEVTEIWCDCFHLHLYPDRAASLNWEESMGERECPSTAQNNAALAWTRTPCEALAERKVGSRRECHQAINLGNRLETGHRLYRECPGLLSKCQIYSKGSEWHQEPCGPAGANGKSHRMLGLASSKSSRRSQSRYVWQHCTGPGPGRSSQADPGKVYRDPTASYPYHLQSTHSPSFANTLKISLKKRSSVRRK